MSKLIFADFRSDYNRLVVCYGDNDAKLRAEADKLIANHYSHIEEQCTKMLDARTRTKAAYPRNSEVTRPKETRLTPVEFQRTLDKAFKVMKEFPMIRLGQAFWNEMPKRTQRWDQEIRVSWELFYMAGPNKETIEFLRTHYLQED